MFFDLALNLLPTAARCGGDTGAGRPGEAANKKGKSRKGSNNTFFGFHAFRMGLKIILTGSFERSGYSNVR
jgi:hypothetical protein